MGNPYLLDFSPVTNALAAYQKQKNSDRDFAESQRQFDSRNYLAQSQLDLQRQSASREAQAAPLKLDLLRTQIEAAKRSGATEAQLAPLKIELMRAQAGLANAQASAAKQKDELNSAIAGMIRGAVPGAGAPAVSAAPTTPPTMGPSPAPMQTPPNGGGSTVPRVQPQSFNGPPTNYLAPTPASINSPPAVQGGRPSNYLAGDQPEADPLLIRTQASSSPTARQRAVSPQPPGALINTPMGPMTMEQAQRTGFALGLAGKGDAGKMLLDAASANKLAKEARNKIDEQEMNAINALGRLKQIASGYKDEYLTIEGKLRNYGISWLDSSEALRKRLSPEDLQRHAEFVAFQRDAYENLTTGIKEATGAAMGVQEEARIRKGLPDPQKDGPTAFKAKLLSSMNSLELAIQRTQFLRQNGFTGNANSAAARMPIERFKGVLRDSRDLYQRMRAENPGADDGAIRDAVRQQIRTKYRINA